MIFIKVCNDNFDEIIEVDNFPFTIGRDSLIKYAWNS